MTINLNNPNELTIENVKKLIASKDDTQHRQLRVNKHGHAYISDVVGNVKIDDLAFRDETWMMGNGYCGVDASEDSRHVKEVYETLKNNWPNPTNSFLGN